MSEATLTPQDTRRRNLVRVAILSAALSLPVAVYDVYLGLSSRTLFYHLAAGILTLLFVVSVGIIRARHAKKPFLGTWHLLTMIAIVFILSSSLQSNVGAEMGTALLIIVLVISIQVLPPEQIIRGAIFGIIVSIVASLMVFYSPLPQEVDPRIDIVTIWIARGSTVAVLVLAMTQFRTLNISNKLLIAFLGTVVLLSQTFNIVMSTSAAQTMTEQVGQNLQSEAEVRSLLIGDVLSGQVENLQTLALNESIQAAVATQNSLYSGDETEDLEVILARDQEWRETYTKSDTTNLFVNWRLTNAAADDLSQYRALSPDNLESFATDKKGAIVGTNNLTSDYYQADEDWWQITYNDGQGGIYIGIPEPTFFESTNTFGIAMGIAVPIYNDFSGDVDGILRTTLRIDNLVEIVQGGEEDNNISEIDILFPSQPATQLHSGQLEVVEPIVIEHIAELEQSGQFFSTTTYNGERSIFTSLPVRTVIDIPEVNELGWKTVIHQKEAIALAPVREQTRTTSFLGTFLAGIAALLSLAVSQRISRPIVNLTETANRFAEGDLSARALTETQDEIGQLAKTYNSMSAQLQETLSGLEKRVEERTHELEQSAAQLQKRAAQFETIAQLARTITSVQDLESLLHKITQLVSGSFGFYHTGLFLLDESRQYAVLSAANSEGGQKMLERKHRLGVGQIGIVGYVTDTGNPRIALDTGSDAVYFDNPDLPDTRSEMALPLRVGTTIVGALDVQSKEPNAFSEDDVEVLSILADVVSVAIENARLFEESQRVLAEAQTAFSESTMLAWQQLTKKRETIGYTLSGPSIRPLEKPLKSAGIQKAKHTGKLSIYAKGKKKKAASLSVPIKLREQIVGTMNISLPEDQEWDHDEVDITQALAERVGIAIESATLLEESRRRALKEQAIGEITGKIGTSINLRNVLQTAVEELGQALPGSEVVIQFTDKNGSGGSN